MDKKVEPRGIRNNNPLNIRVGNNWQGEVTTKSDPVFEEFETMQLGVRAGFKILKKYMSGYNGLTQKFNTIEKIIRRWAPEAENDVKTYIDFVSKKTGIPSKQILSFDQRRMMVAIVDAMIQMECGKAIDLSIIESAYDLV